MELDAGSVIWLAGLFVVLLIATVFGLMVYSGIFYLPHVRSERPIIGQCLIAYKFVRGAYKSVAGPAFTEVTSIAPKHRCIGIYYDNPEEVPARKQRCAIGCILSDSNLLTSKQKPSTEAIGGSEEVPARKQRCAIGCVLSDAATAVVSQATTAASELHFAETKKLLVKHGYQFHNLSAADMAVTSVFPYTTPFSLLFAYQRVYALLAEYIKLKGLCAYPFVEVYQDNQIYFMAPLSKQEDFMVLETSSPSHDDDDEEGGEHDDGHAADASVSSLFGNVAGFLKDRNFTKTRQKKRPKKRASSSDDERVAAEKAKAAAGVRRRKVSSRTEKTAMASGSSRTTSTSIQETGARDNLSENENNETDTTESSAGSSFEQVSSDEKPRGAKGKVQ